MCSKQKHNTGICGSIRALVFLLFGFILNVGFSSTDTSHRIIENQQFDFSKNSGMVLNTAQIDTILDIEEEVSEEDENPYEILSNRNCNRIVLGVVHHQNSNSFRNRIFQKLYILYKQLKINPAK